LSAPGTPDESSLLSNARPPGESGHALEPILIDAAVAHREGYIEYAEDGTVVCRHPALLRYRRSSELHIAPDRQYPAIRATFEDLNKALSRLSNSPLIDGRHTLRQMYDAEADHYEVLAGAAYAEGKWEPDYGTYVIDHWGEALYLIAPARWHRLALVTSNAMLVTDPELRFSWQEMRRRLEGAVVGFAGASVGGNICEGWLREARPDRIKIADPDWIELTNLNRGERMNLRHVVASRAKRFEARNPYDSPRISKAEYLAYEQQLVDPYTKFYVYKDGITRANIDRFLCGDGRSEPRLDVLVEEMDDLELKFVVREACRKHGIDVIMLSDFGNSVDVLWNFFGTEPEGPIGFAASDDALRAALVGAKSGDRAKVIEFGLGLCGHDVARDQFKAWLEGRGEQMTAALPQSGATALASGGIGGKEIALHILGHHVPGPRRVVYDLFARNAFVPPNP
jgi:hypothetical protein